MNIAITLGVAAFALCLLWAVQSVMLIALGEPLAWPLRYATPKPAMRWTGQVMIQISWLVILVGTPLALGIPLFDALWQAFPLPPPWHRIAIVSAITFSAFASCSRSTSKLDGCRSTRGTIRQRVAPSWYGVSWDRYHWRR